MNSNYFIFRSRSGNRYLFDNSTGFAMPYSPIAESIIRHLGTVPKDQLFALTCEAEPNTRSEDFEKSYTVVRQLHDSGFWRQEKADRSMSEDEYLQSLYDASSSQLLFILTNDCNMRCRYCVYSDMYPNVIPYRQRSMDFQTCRKAIDYYVTLHRERRLHGRYKAPAISFYGGEPLLQMALIRQIVEYCKNAMGADVDYYITTNGLLLDQSSAEFFVDNNFRVTVSLDGDAENHDRNRVTVGNQGTHSLILRNVQMFFRLQKQAKARRSTISFNCCYDDYTSVDSIAEFFENDPVFSGQDYFVFFSQINPYGTTYYDYCNRLSSEGLLKGTNKTWKTEIEQHREKLVQQIAADDQVSPIVRSLFTSYYFYSNRSLGLVFGIMELHRSAVKMSQRWLAEKA